MASNSTTIHQLVLLLVWTCLSAAPEKHKRSIFTKVLSSLIVVEQLLSSASLSFAPGLFEVLQASTPPAVAFFKGLPTERRKLWAVYLLVFEKPGCRPMIYIGSGTGAKAGVSTRLVQYDKDMMQVTVPRLVSRALLDGYTIVHKGLLCSTSLPSADMVPVLRVLFVALEATFTFVFWALSCKTDYGYGMAHICVWARDTLEYDGLCSHSPFTELPAGDHSLSAEELEAQALETLRRLSENVQRCREKAKREDPAKYKATTTKNRRKFVNKNPAAAKAIDKRSIAKAVKEQRHYCDVCKHSFIKKAKLTKHLAGPKHAGKVARLEEASRNPPKHYCGICNDSFTRKANLREHLTTPKHATQAALLEAAGPKHAAQAALLEAAGHQQN